MDVVPAAQLRPSASALAHQRLEQGRLARAVGADEADVLAALEPHPGVLDQRSVADLDPRVLELERDPPERSALPNEKASVRRSRGSLSIAPLRMRSICLSFDCAWRALVAL